MKKHFLKNISIGVLIFLLSAGAAESQGWLKKTEQAARAVRRAKQGMRISREATVIPTGPAPRFERMEEMLERALLAEEQKKIADRLARLQAGEVYRGRKGVFLRSTFQALADDLYRYSGTVFKINYEGQEEIYGVIAAHVIVRNKQSPRFVHKKFSARVYTNGKFITIPAEIVQVGTPGMLDIALVKFRPEDEDLFEPLPISPQEIADGNKVRRQGFAVGKVMYMPERPLLYKNDLFFCTRIPNMGKLCGTCGGAVVNEKNELVGIQIGVQTSILSDGIGYAAHAKFLEVLVAAYHNGGEALYPFELAGQTILSLRPDEYVSEIVLRTSDAKKIYRYDIDNKTEYTEIEKDIQHYGARYIELTVRRVNWKHVRKDEVLMDHSDAVVGAHLRTYVYDLQSQKIVSDSKYTVLKKHFFPHN